MQAILRSRYGSPDVLWPHLSLVGDRTLGLVLWWKPFDPDGHRDPVAALRVRRDPAGYRPPLRVGRGSGCAPRPGGRARPVGKLIIAVRGEAQDAALASR